MSKKGQPETQSAASYRLFRNFAKLDQELRDEVVADGGVRIYTRASDLRYIRRQFPPDGYYDISKLPKDSSTKYPMSSVILKRKRGRPKKQPVV